MAVDAGRPVEYHLLERGLERGLYRRQEAVFQAVVDGEAPAALLPLPIAGWFARGKLELRVFPLREPSLDVALGVAARATDRELTAAVDQALEKLLANGQAQEILARYGALVDD